MAIKLGARPKSFKRTITFPMIEGGKGTIEVVYKYRTRMEFGEFVDEFTERGRRAAEADKAAKEAAREQAQRAAAEAGQPELEGDSFSLAEFHDRNAQANADYILEIAEGWNLDVPFDREHVVQLANELPGAASEMIEQYRAAITEGRLGN